MNTENKYVTADKGEGEMLSVFKKYQGWFIMCECGLAVLVMAFVYDGAKWPAALSIFAGLSAVAFIAMESAAGIMHRKILCILYIEQKPGEFIAAYKPLTELTGVRRNIMFSMKAYLSTGYAAQGDFESALSVLEKMPQLPGKRQLSGEALISGNRCSFYLDAGDLQKAEREYETFTRGREHAGGRLRKELEAADELLRLKLALARGKCGRAEEDGARELLKKSSSPLLRTQLQLLTGQIYLQTGRADFAKEYFKIAAAGGKTVWAAKKAASLLK